MVTGIDRACWRKSTYSGDNGGGCVEVARNLPGVVAVRDSKDPGGPKLAFAPDEWRAFTAGIKAGEFDVT
jgi:Domain of unknown function (DUF397)